VATATQARRDIGAQQVRDRDFGNWQEVLVARMTACLQAQEARAEREPDADVTFRQSLIDLASIAELIADELPSPR
jgi:hypothetical protein